MARGWKGEPGRHGLAAKGIKTGRARNLTMDEIRPGRETPEERDVRLGYAKPLKFTEPVKKLHRLAKKYQPGISKEKVVFMAKRNPMSFFMDLTGQMPLNAQTRKDSDKMAKLALELN